MMRITRHFADVRNADGSVRRVHYRLCGEGPPLLLVHQSPRSGAEYEPLMRRWAAEGHQCIAPDTAGFGDSAPLPIAEPECEDYADALVALLDALGLTDVAAYGFHSGAIILITAVKRAPRRFRAVAAGGYAVWTAEERADFGARYTPPFVPRAYGEHLAWAWGRVLEQGWFFPWYRTDDANRLPIAHDDPGMVQPTIMDMLAAGDSFSKGYAAVLRAKRDVPAADAETPPVLIVAYPADPLHAHLARLGELPPSWRAVSVGTPDAALTAALDWLRPHVGEPQALAGAAADQGFVAVAAGGFDGLIHWRGQGDTLLLHAPGGALTAFAAGEGLALDLPGHGLSDDWPDAPGTLDAWADAVVAAMRALGAAPSRVEGRGWSVRLAAAVAARLNVAHEPARGPKGQPAEWIARGLPDLTPDRFGAHLLRGWGMLRAESFFEPWFDVRPANARAFDPAEVEPEALAVRFLALMRARRAQELMAACVAAGGESDGHS